MPSELLLFSSAGVLAIVALSALLGIRQVVAPRSGRRLPQLVDRI